MLEAIWLSFLELKNGLDVTNQLYTNRLQVKY